MTRIFLSFIALVALNAPVFAETHKSMQCETGPYKLTTYQSPTAQNEILILVQQDDMGIYSQVFSELYQESPIQAWHLRELQNSNNVLNVVAVGEDGAALADVHMEMGEYGTLRAFGISCQLNIFKVQ